jgi:hypothetical protein
VSLLAGYRFALGARWDLEVSGRVTVDPIVRKADQRLSSLPVADDSLRVFSSGAGGFGFGYSPIRQVRLAVTLGAEVLITRADYVVFAPEHVSLVQPHPARFFMDAGLHFGLIWRKPRPPRGAR